MTLFIAVIRKIHRSIKSCGNRATPDANKTRVSHNGSRERKDIETISCPAYGQIISAPAEVSEENADTTIYETI